MSLILNVIWLVLSGLWLAIGYVLAGILMCILIITIPFGIQSFKLAGFALWPFGRAVVKRPDRSRALSAIGNVLWFVLAGIWLAIVHIVTGVLLCITIIGIPLGIANFKLVPLALVPFGKEVVPRSQATGSYVAF
ncbi:MAG: YccF domain-containing protein [Acidimicrobiia bacterium]